MSRDINCACVMSFTLKCLLISCCFGIMNYQQLFVQSTEFTYHGPFMNICKDGLENIDPGCCSSKLGRYRFLRNETIRNNEFICITDALAMGKDAR